MEKACKTAYAYKCLEKHHFSLSLNLIMYTLMYYLLSYEFILIGRQTMIMKNGYYNMIKFGKTLFVMKICLLLGNMQYPLKKHVFLQMAMCVNRFKIPIMWFYFFFRCRVCLLTCSLQSK